jgi:hypothetical protein
LARLLASLETKMLFFPREELDHSLFLTKNMELWITIGEDQFGSPSTTWSFAPVRNTIGKTRKSGKSIRQ